MGGIKNFTAAQAVCSSAAIRSSAGSTAHSREISTGRGDTKERWALVCFSLRFSSVLPVFPNFLLSEIVFISTSASRAPSFQLTFRPRTDSGLVASWSRKNGRRIFCGESGEEGLSSFSAVVFAVKKHVSTSGHSMTSGKLCHRFSKHPRFRTLRKMETRGGPLKRWMGSLATSY